MRGVEVVLQALEPVVFLLDDAELDVRGRQVVELEIGEGRRLGAVAHVEPDHAIALVRAVRLGLDLVLEILVRRHVRHVEAVAVHVELPAVIDAAEAVIFVAPIEQGGAAVRAAMVEHAEPAARVAEGDQGLAQRGKPHRVAVGLHLAGQRHRHPVFAHQRAHRRARPDPGQKLVLARRRHRGLPSVAPSGGLCGGAPQWIKHFDRTAKAAMYERAQL